MVFFTLKRARTSSIRFSVVSYRLNTPCTVATPVDATALATAGICCIIATTGAVPATEQMNIFQHFFSKRHIDFLLSYVRYVCRTPIIITHIVIS